MSGWMILLALSSTMSNFLSNWLIQLAVNWKWVDPEKKTKKKQTNNKLVFVLLIWSKDASELHQTNKNVQTRTT
jgi:uncharacterized membrane protein